MPWPIHWTIYLAGAPCRVCLFSQYQGPTIIRSATRYSLGLVVVVIVQSLGRVRHSSTPWTAARQASLSIINSQTVFKLMSIESVMPSNHLMLCHPLLLLPSIFPSIRVFSIESVLHIRWPKYCSFSFSHSHKHSGLISFRNDWFDLLAIQGTLENLL